MKRSVACVLPLLVGIALLATGVLAQAQPPGGMGGPPRAGGGMMMMGGPGIPGYWNLGSESVQKELKLTDEQKQKLRQISDTYMKQMRERGSALQGLSPEEVREKMAELQKESAKAAEDARKQVGEILTSEQLAQLKEITFRSYAMSLLSNPRVLTQVGLSEDQQAKLRKVREEFQEKVQKLQQEMVDDALKVLTPEQQKKLKEMQAGGGPRF